MSKMFAINGDGTEGSADFVTSLDDEGCLSFFSIYRDGTSEIHLSKEETDQFVSKLAEMTFNNNGRK